METVRWFFIQFGFVHGENGLRLCEKKSVVLEGHHVLRVILLLLLKDAGQCAFLCLKLVVARIAASNALLLLLLLRRTFIAASRGVTLLTAEVAS